MRKQLLCSNRVLKYGDEKVTSWLYRLSHYWCFCSIVHQWGSSTFWISRHFLVRNSNDGTSLFLKCTRSTRGSAQWWFYLRKSPKLAFDAHDQDVKNKLNASLFNMTTKYLWTVLCLWWHGIHLGHLCGNQVLASSSRNKTIQHQHWNGSISCTLTDNL